LSALQPGNVITLQNQGNIPGSTWLNGITQNGTVDLVPTKDPYTGTKWKVYGYGVIALENQGSIPGSKWLDGRTAEGSVGFVPTKDPYTGTKWRVELAP
jgi:hypothetical protein